MTTALTMSLVIAPPERSSRLSVESHLIQLQAVTLSSVTNGSAALGAASSTTSPADLVANGIHANRSAAATADSHTDTSGSIWDTPLGTVLFVVNFLLLPIWFLFTPITLPLSMIAGAAAVSDPDSPLSTLEWLIGTGIAFITGPIGALDLIIRSSSTSPAASVARSAASVEEAPGEPPATLDETAASGGRGHALRDKGLRHASINPAAARSSKRSASSAAAVQSPDETKSAQVSRSAKATSKGRAVAEAVRAIAPRGTAGEG